MNTIRNSDSASYGRAVACPRCHAAAGQVCRNALGQPTVAHYDRVNRAAREAR